MRFRMLLAMAALALLIAGVVVCASPYAPVMTAAPQDIEVIWAIEDARQQSETPLVTHLEMDGRALGYDAASNTFYCPLGMDNGEAWPEIRLTAPQAEGVRLTFVDDYSYDWCTDAIRDGYAYEALAYTDEAYAYFSVVFTGLPMLCIDTDGQEIAEQDTAVRVTMAAYGEAGLDITARAHLRGASTLLYDKLSYKLEFTRERDGGAKKIEVDAPGFGRTDEIALLSCAQDDTKMRDKLNWDLWSEIASDDEPFGARRTAYVEVFIDDAYQGLYLMVEPVDVEEELARCGDTHPATDSVYRTAALNFSRDRTYYTHPLRGNAGYELYYAPPGAKDFDAQFAGLADYLALIQTQDDEAFAARARAIIDEESMLRHVLFVQGCGLADNVFNNMYIWATPGDGGTTYHFSLWDLDMSWGLETKSIGSEYENWMYFPVADRMLNLDVDGIRARAYHRWQEMRERIFDEEALQARVSQYTALLEDSGAFARDAQRWNTEIHYPDGYEIVTFASIRWPLIDQAMQTLVETDGAVGFLSHSQYEAKGGPIWDTQGE